jgi:hypothetical protein
MSYLLKCAQWAPAVLRYPTKPAAAVPPRVFSNRRYRLAARPDYAGAVPRDRNYTSAQASRIQLDGHFWTGFAPLLLSNPDLQPFGGSTSPRRRL